MKVFPGSPRSIAQRGKLLVAVPVAFQVVVLIALAGILRVSAHQQETHEHSQQIITAAQQLTTQLADIEANIRGYIMTEDVVFIEPYQRASKAAPHLLTRLRNLAGPANTSAIDRATHEFITYHELNLRRVQTDRRNDALRALRNRTGKRLMDAFRSETTRFLAEHQIQLDERSSAVRRSTRYMTAGLAVGFVLNVVIAFGAAAFFTRSISDRVALLTDNAARFEHDRPLNKMQQGGDEIAELDRRFHEMAGAVTAGRRQLEQTNQELESFSYTVSHDLRAPIRALNGFARILEEDYAGTLDEEGRRYLGVIRSEAERMGSLIDDLLAFSRLGKAQLRRSAVDMTVLAMEVAREVVGDRADVNVQPLPKASGDRAMLRHVLVNLIANAAKFSEPKGRAAIEVGASANGSESTYWVRDHGVGFDMRYVDKLFGVFQRLHSETEFEGTGVGLAIVKRVVERHGGRVWAEAKPGEGASFFFTLPQEEGEL